MIKKTVERLICCEGSTGAEFAEQFNVTAQELSGKHYEKIWNLNQGHCCYFVYTEEQCIPESIEDEYTLKGEHYFCGDCPFFIVSKLKPDKGTCTHDDVSIRTRDGLLSATQKACSKLYQGLKDGTIALDEEWRG